MIVCSGSDASYACGLSQPKRKQNNGYVCMSSLRHFKIVSIQWYSVQKENCIPSDIFKHHRNLLIWEFGTIADELSFYTRLSKDTLRKRKHDSQLLFNQGSWIELNIDYFPANIMFPEMLQKQKHTGDACLCRNISTFYTFEILQKMAL